MFAFSFLLFILFLFESFSLPVTFHRNHGCEIVKVRFLMQRFKRTGHLLTVTKDGILQIWSEGYSLLNSFRVRRAHPWSTQEVFGEPLPLYPDREGDPDSECTQAWGS